MSLAPSQACFCLHKVSQQAGYDDRMMGCNQQSVLNCNKWRLYSAFTQTRTHIHRVTFECYLMINVTIYITCTFQRFREIFYTYMIVRCVNRPSFFFSKDVKWLFPHLISPYRKRSGISPPKAHRGNMRKLFTDHSVHILLHTQRKRLSESGKKSKSDLPE